MNVINCIILFGSLITAVGVIIKALQKMLDKMFQPIHKKIDNLDLEQARNFLVDFLADIENGVPKDECQIERAYESYDHYTNDLGGNSYIHAKWEKVMKKRSEEK